MQIHGKLVDNYIVVDRPRDVGRLYTKSCFGRIQPGNILHLNLIEGLFLLQEKKIQIREDRTVVDFSYLFQLAAAYFDHLEILYQVFRDLRKRGYMLQVYDSFEHVAFRTCQQAQKSNDTIKYIAVFAERDILRMVEVHNLLRQIMKREGVLWFAIVDEEGDITYYHLSLMQLSGYLSGYKYSNGTGYLLDTSVVVMDEALSHELFTQEFFGKPFGDGLQLSFVESLYLMEQGVLGIKDVKSGKKITESVFVHRLKQVQPDIMQRIQVFRELKKQGLVVKTGFKFGAHFRVYTRSPDERHAEYLVHVVDELYSAACSEMSRAVRLAHSVNKEIIFAEITPGEVYYLRFGRLRP